MSAFLQPPALDDAKPITYADGAAPHGQSGIGILARRRTTRRTCAVFFRPWHGKPLSMGGPCGASSDAPVPMSGMPTRMRPPTPVWHRGGGHLSANT